MAQPQAPKARRCVGVDEGEAQGRRVVVFRVVFPSRVSFRPVIESLAARLGAATSSAAIAHEVEARLAEALPGRAIEVVTGAGAGTARVLDVAWQEPLVTAGGALGCVRVGHREDRSLLTQSDLTLLEVVASVAALALANLAARGGAAPIAAISLIYMDPAQREAVKTQIAPHYALVDIPRCAAEQYPRIVLGENDITIFERTLAWDHAAGVLFLNEAGGKVCRPDGSPYRVDEHMRPSLIGAATPALWDELAERMAGI